MTTPPNQPPTPPTGGGVPPQPPYGGAPQPSQPLSPSDEKLWATLVHVGGIFIGFWSSLIGYLILKDRGPFVRAHTATALNFQLTLVIAEIVGWITTFILIGFLILGAVYIVRIIFSIIAAVAANKGDWYTYPLSIKFVS